MRTRFIAGIVVGLAAAGTALAAPTRSSSIAVAPSGAVFVVNPDSNTVARLDFDGNGAGVLAAEAAVGTYPRTVAVAGSWAYTADQTGDTVTRVDQNGLGNPVTRQLGFGCAPYGVAATPAGDLIVVTCQGTSEVVLLDPGLGEQARVKLPWSNARAIAISSDGSRAYVTHYLTEEPNHDAHVSVVDLAQKSVAQVLSIPPDLGTCETQNSGQGVFNLLSAIALMPDRAPAEVANQVWVGGTQENTISKGLFKRHAAFKKMDGSALFPWVEYTPFPDGGANRNVYKSSFHDITRFGLYKVDLGSGNVVGKIDVDEANNATDIELSADGRVAYVVDVMFNSYHVINTARGQGTNPTTVFAGVAANGPGGADPSRNCTPEPLRSVTGESPFRMAPQAQISVLDPINPVRLDGGTFTAVATGLEFDTAHFLRSGEGRMMTVPDGIGTAPHGVRLAPDGFGVYVASYLSRNVVKAGAAEPLASGGKSQNLRCSSPPNQPCGTSNDCAGGVGFCNHPGGPACNSDAECGDNGPCVRTSVCVPLMLGQPVSSITGGAGKCSVPVDAPCVRDDDCDPEPGFCNTTGNLCATDGECGGMAGALCITDRRVCIGGGGDPLPAQLLDGKILFNTAARDASVGNGVGLDNAAPLFNFATIAQKVPGSVTSVAHDASYVTCSTCHADFGGQDGRTWDFSQFGASLRNTMDLRGRAGFLPGECKGGPNDEQECFFDAACGPGFFCGVRDDADVPPNVTGPDRARWFNPMLTVHWNGDRDEVEDFEHTYRSLLGAGDCDGVEFAATCQGALVQRSPQTSVDPVDVNGDLGPPNRNIRGPLTDELVGIRLTNMADFVYSLTAFPKNPNTMTEAAERGRRIFNDPATQCASCHNGGPGAGKQFFTDKKPNAGFDVTRPARADGNNPFIRHDVGTANLFDAMDPLAVAGENQSFQNPGNPPDMRTIPGSRGNLGDYVTPVLNDLWNTPPYLHDGSAHTLLDVVRPCDSAADDCMQAGRGRNLRTGGVERHGATSFLTPRQLNDLVAFQNALTLSTAVGTNETVLDAGDLALQRVVLALPRARKRGGTTRSVLLAKGTLSGARAAIDPAAGVTVQLATPDPATGRMVVIERVLTMQGRGRRFVGRATEDGGSLTLLLRQRREGYAFVLKTKRLDLAALDTGNTDLTVALEMNGAQFVENRNLAPKKNVLSLPKKRRARRA